MVDKERDYTPSLEHRFVISSDPFSQVRYSTIIQVFYKLKALHPPFVGITLFGSLSKGKLLTPDTAGATDIDLAVFVEFEATDGSETAKEACKEKTNLLIRAEYPRNLPLGNVDIHPFFISKVLGNRGFLEDYLDYLVEMNKLMDEFTPWGARLPASPFGMDIEGGLKPFRRAWLEYLKGQGEEGEQTWQTVNHCTKVWERGEDIPESLTRFYPETLEEAIAYYLP